MSKIVPLCLNMQPGTVYMPRLLLFKWLPITSWSSHQIIKWHWRKSTRLSNQQWNVKTKTDPFTLSANELPGRFSTEHAHEKLLTGLDLATGYSRKLVDSIVSKIHDVRSVLDLKDKFAFFSEVHATETWQIICEVLAMSESESESELSGETYAHSRESKGSDTCSSSEAESDSSDIARRRTRKLRVFSSSDKYSSSSD